MDEEIFLHVAVFFLVKNNIIPPLESIVSNYRELPRPSEITDQISSFEREPINDSLWTIGYITCIQLS